MVLIAESSDDDAICYTSTSQDSSKSSRLICGFHKDNHAAAWGRVSHVERSIKSEFASLQRSSTNCCGDIKSREQQ
eukprot:1161107-Pleurochrysis_carterae.AAC.1